MDRIIKFRAFNKVSHIMYYPECTPGEFNHYMQIGSGGFWMYNKEGALICTSVRGDILMQFTGLKDKNGKEIYEGDKLRGFQKEQNDVGGKNGWQVTDTVNFFRGGFNAFGKCLQNAFVKDGDILNFFSWCIHGNMVNDDLYYDIIDIEIIGNIHELNPLKEGVLNMNIDPNAKSEDAAGEQAAQESASQDQATGANESAEEGTTEG